jgi:hypothetical protein
MSDEVVVMSPAKAKLQLALLNSSAANLEKRDFIVRFTNAGLPQEIVVRLDEWWDTTKIVAGEIINIGRIVIQKIWEFVAANPNMLIGAAVGAAIGALVGLVPFIGPMLAPAGMTIGAVLGGIWGFESDRENRGEIIKRGPIGVAENLVGMAQEFFKLFAGILIALKEYFTA